MSLDHLPYDPETHKVRVMCGDPVALSYEWIKAYAENLSDRAKNQSDEYNTSEVTVDELIDSAMSNMDPNSWGNYIIRGGAFEGYQVEPLFWEKLAILKGIEIPQENQNNFFSCSC